MSKWSINKGEYSNRQGWAIPGFVQLYYTNTTGGKIGKTILYAIPILYQRGTAELKG